MKKLLTCVLLSTLVGANAEAITFKNPRDIKVVFMLQPKGTPDKLSVSFRNNESSITRNLTAHDIPPRYMQGYLYVLVGVYGHHGHHGYHEILCPEPIDLNLGFQAINEKTVTYDPADPKGPCIISK